MRPCPAEHIGPRRRRARGSWRSSPRRGLHGCRANRSEDRVTLVGVTEENEVRRSCGQTQREGVVKKIYICLLDGLHHTFICIMCYGPL